MIWVFLVLLVPSIVYLFVAVVDNDYRQYMKREGKAPKRLPRWFWNTGLVVLALTVVAGFIAF